MQWIGQSSMPTAGLISSRSANSILNSKTEDEEDEDGTHQKKKYRYRWPDEIRDEVLARLLELNRQRALEEGKAFRRGWRQPLDAKIEEDQHKKKAETD